MAGNEIILESGTVIAPGPGGYFEASIAPCNSTKDIENNIYNGENKKNTNKADDVKVNKTNNVEIIAYPNPFTDKCNIEYTLQNECNVNIEVYNLLGEKVYEANPSKKFAGKNTILLTDNELSEKGIYIVKIQTKDSKRTLFILKQ